MIYWFRGHFYKGIDLMGSLEDKIMEIKRNLLSEYVGRSWKKLPKGEFEYWYKELGFDKVQKGAFEGCNPDMIYYNSGICVRMVRRHSIKGLFIRIFGKRIRK